MHNNIPLSLYIHIPWCVKKCPYCDFNSHEKNDSFDEDNYVKALLLDLDAEYQACSQRTLHSIFFGGGTPSLFSANSIEKIILHAQKLFQFDTTGENKIEITLEANPGTFEQEKFTGFKNAGVNRLSIGIQSFDDKHLKTLGRIHNKDHALMAIDTARHAGFENFNLDLMFGLPEQTVQQAVNDIEIACNFQPNHISHYQLTIEENTYFYKHTPVLPESDLLWEMQTQCQNILLENNYSQYEISAYAKTDNALNTKSLHNINYWEFGDYIGIGAGAHGKITDVIPETNKLKINRRWKHRQPKQYIEETFKNNANSGAQMLAEKDIVFEFLLNALRLKNGCDIDTFKKHTGLNNESLHHAIKNIDPSLLIVDDKKIVTSKQGFLFLNDILEQLV